MEWHDTPVVQSILLEAASFSLIFGGCCSNVYALEAIISFEPSSGTLLTFTQFLFVAVTSYISRFDKTRPPFYLKKAKVPLRRWLVNIVLFFSINLLNNHAFSYSISVPLHIILRSGGSITTMLAGYLFGKRYSRLQALAVTLLSFGIALAAWSNDEAKVSPRLFASFIAKKSTFPNTSRKLIFTGASVNRLIRKSLTGLCPPSAFSYYLWPSCSRLSWVSIQRPSISNSARNGEKIYSTRISFHYHFFSLSCLPWLVSWVKWLQVKESERHFFLRECLFSWHTWPRT